MYKIITNVKDLAVQSAITSIQEQSLKEGNNAITPDKFDVNKTEGTPILILWEDRPAGMAFLEPSWYTGDPDVAVRACRYHILKEYRNKKKQTLLVSSLLWLIVGC